MKPVSLRWRLTLLVCLLLVAGFAIISYSAYYEMEESLWRHAGQTLQAMVNAALASASDHGDDDRLEHEVQAIVYGSSHKRSGRYRLWYDGQPVRTGPVDLAESDRLFGPALASPPALGTRRLAAVGLGKDEYRILWARQSMPRGVFNVAIAYSSRNAFHELQEFLVTILVIGGAVVAVTAAATCFVVLWGLRPIRDTARRLEQVTSGQDLRTGGLARRDDPHELRPFVQAVSDMLGRLDRAMQVQRRFTADASHELRTPLAVAKSTLQAVRNRPRDSSEYERAIDETLADLKRMERLISQLLLLARLDDQPPPPERSRVRLDELVRQAAQQHACAQDAGGRLVVQPMPPLEVRGEAELLAVMAGNLIQNALVHGPPGGQVTVGLSGDDRRVRLCVRDEGGQIPPQVLEKVFDRFYRVDASRSSATGGTGLGLALAREIARRHGGDIDIVSAPDQGTLVTVQLPADDAIR